MSNYLVTGATGVVGNAVTQELLKTGNTVHALLRAKSDEHFASRQELFLTSLDLKRSSDLIHFIRGDLTQPLLGLTEDVHRALAQSIQHVIHCAGNVRLDQGKQAAQDFVLQTTKQVVKFCLAAQANSQFQKLDILSTVGIMGKTDGTLAEDFLSTKPIFHNAYEHSKFMMELYLRDEVLNGLATTIIRPSMVVGNSQTGSISGFQVFYHLCDLLIGKKSYGLCPTDIKRTLDTIPVDTLAKAIVAISQDSTTVGEVINACSGPEDSIEIESLRTKVTELAKDWDTYPKYRLGISLGWATKTIDRLQKLEHSSAVTVLPKSFRRKLHSISSLQHLTAYAKTDQFFANHRFKQILENHQIPLPKIEEYLSTILNYYFAKTQPISVPTLSSSAVIREARLFEFYREWIWPIHRKFLRQTLKARCSRCGLSESCSPLISGVCQYCKDSQPKPLSNVRNHKQLCSEMNELIRNNIAKNNSTYDACVLFSGGKDSTYLIYRLQKEFPSLRIVALTFDNSFMSPVAMANIQSTIFKLGVDHVILSPNPRMMERLYSYAFTHLNDRGCSGTVDQFDGDLLHDAARNYAATNKIPLLFSGVSADQVENILHVSSFKTKDEDEHQTRKQVAGIELSKIFTADEMNWWWDGSKWDHSLIPKVIFPFYAWNIGEKAVKNEVIKHKYLKAKQLSPLITNNQLVMLMGVVDVHQFGYSSFEPEFCRNVRSGHSSLTLWQHTFELLEFTAKTPRFIGNAIDAPLKRLGLNRKTLNLPERRS